MCQLEGVRGGCNGGGPPFSNSWAELKRCSLSIITDHIRLFMAAAHPSAPSSRIMPHQKAWIISDWLLHDTEHIVLQTPPQSSSLSAIEQLRRLTPQNCALKGNHPAFYGLFFWLALETLGNRFEQDLCSIRGTCTPTSCSRSWSSFTCWPQGRGLQVPFSAECTGGSSTGVIFFISFSLKYIFHCIAPPFVLVFIDTAQLCICSDT